MENSYWPGLCLACQSRFKRETTVIQNKDLFRIHGQVGIQVKEL